MQNLRHIKSIIDSEYEFFLREHDRWSLLTGPKNNELVAHALRVLLHIGEVNKYGDEFLSAAENQHRDGGWGGESDNDESAAWVSAFMALMLIRGNQILKSPKISRAVEKSIDYFLKNQKEDGRWIDSSWADLDTTSHPVSFFNVVLALGEPAWKRKVHRCWKMGLQFIVENQHPDGAWVDEKFHPTGVETTAHLVQDAVIASLVLPEKLDYKKTCRKGMEKLISFQASNGSYDNENVDHTMDSTRSLIIISRLLNEEKNCGPVIEKGITWILGVKNAFGWPDFPDMKTNLERTCDGLDTLLKYLAYREKSWEPAARRWGYMEGIPTYDRKQTQEVIGQR